METIGIVTGLVVAIGALITAVVSLREAKGSFTERITNAANTMMNQMDKRLHDLEIITGEQQTKIKCQEKKISKLERQLRKLFEGAMKLYIQVCDAGQVPVFNPKEVDEDE